MRGPVSEVAPTEIEKAEASAPVRIADVGGWTDTWFGAPGRVCHLAVGPGVTVRAVRTTAEDPANPVTLHLPDLGAAHRFGPDRVEGWRKPGPSRHALLEQAIATVLDQRGWPTDAGISVIVRAAVPPGASLGTSASVVVATLAAVESLTGAQPRTAPEIARMAHRVETTLAGREAGVQDGWAAACGGIELLHIDPYPSTDRRVVDGTHDTRDRLDGCLVTVVLRPHDSSAVHEAVIDRITRSDVAADEVRRTLRSLADLAERAAGLLERGDVDGWGAALTEATEAQAALHPGLVGAAHRQAIAIAEAHGAIGWKVNGAGGDGGSLTVLCADPAAADALTSAFRAHDTGWTVPRLTLAAGVSVRTWSTR